MTLENDTTDSNDTIAEADPEPEPECVLKSVEKLNEQLWIVVPATIGLFFSVIGKHEFFWCQFKMKFF